MKTKDVTGISFDGRKFAVRYALTEREFWESNDPADRLKMLLYFPDRLPDDPVLDPPDPKDPKPVAEIAAVKAGTATARDVQTVVKYLLYIGQLALIVALLSGCGFAQGFRDQGARELADILLAELPAKFPQPKDEDRTVEYSLGALAAVIVGQLGKGALRKFTGARA